jgi:hypothetical protein
MFAKEASTEIPRDKALKIFLGSAVRMMMYASVKNAGNALMLGVLTTLLSTFFGGDDDDEIETKKIPLVDDIYTLFNSDDKEERERIGRQAIGTLLNLTSTLALGGTGNIFKNAVGFGIETANYFKGEGITRNEGDRYNSFDNGIVYSFVNPEIVFSNRPLKPTDVTRAFASNSAQITASIEVIKELGILAFSDSDKKRETAFKKLMLRDMWKLIGSVSGIPLKDLALMGSTYMYEKESSETLDLALELLGHSRKLTNTDRKQYMNPYDTEYALPELPDDLEFPNLPDLE